MNVLEALAGHHFLLINADYLHSNAVQKRPVSGLDDF